jgi:hypothetical protein
MQRKSKAELVKIFLPLESNQLLQRLAKVIPLLKVDDNQLHAK